MIFAGSVIRDGDGDGAGFVGRHEDALDLNALENSPLI